jgi:hypothetical protein
MLPHLSSPRSIQPDYSSARKLRHDQLPGERDRAGRAMHHGFERMRLRGLSGARDEFHLAAIVQNLKTLAIRLFEPLQPARDPTPAMFRIKHAVIQKTDGSERAVPSTGRFSTASTNRCLSTRPRSGLPRSGNQTTDVANGEFPDGEGKKWGRS